MTLLQTALTLSSQGVAVIPVDTAKQPSIASWRDYQTEVPKQDALNYWFSRDGSAALVAGEVQCIDFDTKHEAGIYERFLRAAVEHGLAATVNRCIQQSTPSGGAHLIFRCEESKGNQKLAWADDKQASIETRERGGYFLIAPSPGYKLVRGSFDFMPLISPDERDALHSLARSLCRRPHEQRRQEKPPVFGEDIKPGDDYDAKADVPALLQSHGWVHIHGKLWRRPGKDKGVSASWDEIPGRFWVWTTSTQFQNEHIYKPWHVFAVLECGGDYSEAAKRLKRMGYGSTTPRESLDRVLTEPESPHRAQQAAGLPPILSREEDESKPREKPEELIQSILYRGSKFMLAAPSKARKSWIMIDLGLSVAAGVPWLGFPTAQGNVLYVNFELDGYFARERRREIEKEKFPDQTIENLKENFFVWNLRGYKATLPQIETVMKPFCIERNIALIILDPIYKLTQQAGEENNAEDVGRLLNEFERLSRELNACLCWSHHFAKGNASAKESIDRMSGSGVWARDPDTLMMMTNHEESDCTVADFHLRYHRPVEAFGMRWTFPLWSRALDIDPTETKGSKKPAGGRPAKPAFTKEDLVNVLQRMGQDRLSRENQDEVAEQAGVSKRTLWGRWSQLTKRTKSED